MKPLACVSAAVIVALGLMSGCTTERSESADSPRPPRLVLLIVVDQLGQDRLERSLPRFETDGFARFYREGRVYTNARYGHATTFTATGHASIVTGMPPSRHGIIANGWLTRDGRLVYSVGTRDDPTPDTLLVSGIADRLVTSNPDSRAWAVSLKDRAAVIMAGRRGRSIWYDKTRGTFRARPQPPTDEPWLERWQTAPVDSFWQENQHRWDVAASCDAGTPCDDAARANRRWTEDAGHTTKWPSEDSRQRWSQLRRTPHGDRMVLELVGELVEHERLGTRDGATDFLAVGLSATDYVGHAYGPWSAEYEDQLHHLDRALSDLIQLVDERVGLENTLIALSSDHGVGDASGMQWARGEPGHRLIGRDLVPILNERLRQKLGAPVDLVADFLPSAFYLDAQTLAGAGLDREIVARDVAQLVAEFEGVDSVYVWNEAGPVRTHGSGQFDARVAAVFHPERSGDVIFVAEPGVFVARSDDDAANHGSPHDYDTDVPLMLLGYGVEPGRASDAVSPRQIAPTIASALQWPLEEGWLEPLESRLVW